VDNIGPYLLPTSHNTIVFPCSKPAPAWPRMVFGSMANDGGHLLMRPTERAELLDADPSIARFIRRFAGATESLGTAERFCLWVDEEQVPEALAIPAIAQRVAAVKAFRAASRRRPTQALARVPWRFGEVRHREGQSIIVPRHSSERRMIIPMGYLDGGTIISDAANAIYDAEPWLFALLQSRMHTVWVSAVGGKIKTDYRYSAELCYNTFPAPPLSDADKAQLTQHTLAVLEAREYHADITLGNMYFPEQMPVDLKTAHQALDATVDSLYALLAPTDERRLDMLFEMYTTLTAAEGAAA
jgi:hypothetical protein